MDVGMGILIAIVLGGILGIPVTATWIILGILFALLPDIDLLLTRNKVICGVIGAHRSATHYPVLHVFLAYVVFIIAGKHVVILYAISIFYHLFHDTFFLGWGIKWLWPLSQRSLVICHDKDGKISMNILTWLPTEEAAVKEKYRNPNWIQDFYLRPSFISVLEYGIFIISIAALIFQFRTPAPW